MFTSSPIYVRMRSSRWAQTGSRASWLLMLPGITLIILALAIVIWPELLAYLVAAAILTAGVVLTGWGWGMRQAVRRVRRDNYTIHSVDD